MSRFGPGAAAALVLTASLIVGGCIGERRGGPGAATPAVTAAPSRAASKPPTASPSASAAAPAPSASAEMTGTAGPGCGTGQKGFFAHRDQIQEVLTLGGTPIELTTAAVALRNGTYDADDAIPGYVGLSKDEKAVSVESGGKLILAGKGMTLTGLTAGTVPWATLDFSEGLTTTTAKATVATWRLVSNGRILINAPEKAGDYLLDMTVLWQTECLHGDGTVYGRIVVG